MKVSTILKWVSGGFEGLLGVPLLGATIVIGLAWIPLGVMALLHIATLIFSVREDTNKHGSILGIVTSVVAVIPFVGMIMHILTAIFLLMDAAQTKSKENITISQ